MPLPNITSGTALDVGALPANISQNVRDAGTTFTVFYKYTATANGLLSVFPFGDLVIYTPSILVTDGSTVIVGSSPPNTNLPVQFTVYAGHTYIIRVVTNSAAANPAVLTLKVSLLTQSAGDAGDMLINDDTVGLPGIVTSSVTNYLVKRAIPGMQSGEHGDALLTGQVLLSGDDELARPVLKLYDRNFRLLKIINISPTGVLTNTIPIRSARSGGYFYYAINTNPVTLRKIDSTGALIQEWTLTGVIETTSIAINLAETILYYRSTDALSVKKWNLINNIAAGTLASVVDPITDIINLGDDTILACRRTAAGATSITHYSTAGALLNTYNIATATFAIAPRIGYALDDPISFWAWIHLATSDSQFVNIRVVDGVILQTTNQAQFEEKVYSLSPSATPAAVFGVSNSCPLIVLTQDASLSPSGAGIYEMTPESGKLNDTIYDGLGGTEDVAIPNPFATTYLVGDD